MVEPRDRSLVGHRPRHFDITVALGRRNPGLKPRLFSRPHTHEHGGPSTQDALEFRQRSEPIRLEREMMQDRNAQARVERRLSERQFRRFAPDPVDAHGIPLRWFACAPNQQEATREIEGHRAMALVREERRVSSVARSEIENPRAAR